jgi:hypothetical protein
MFLILSSRSVMSGRRQRKDAPLYYDEFVIGSTAGERSGVPVKIIGE